MAQIIEGFIDHCKDIDAFILTAMRGHWKAWSKEEIQQKFLKDSSDYCF